MTTGLVKLWGASVVGGALGGVAAVAGSIEAAGLLGFSAEMAGSMVPTLAEINESEGAAAGTVSQYDDISKSKRSVNNRETDVTRADFEQNLKNSGYQETINPNNPDIRVYSNNEHSYTTRSKSNQGSPTADFRPNGVKDATLEIRLRR